MLQKFRNFLLANRLFPFALLINFMWVSCTKEQTITKVIDSKSNVLATKTITKSSSGQELFDGIVFGLGETASLLGKTNDIKQLLSTEKEYNDFLEVKNDLYKSIDLKYPNYFNDFKTAILSKDLYQIQAQLKNIGEIVRTSLNIDPSLTQNVITSPKGISNIDYKALLNSNVENKENVKKTLRETIAASQNLQSKDHSNLVYLVFVLAVAVVAVAVLVFSVLLNPNSNSDLFMNNLALSIDNNL